MQELQLLHHSSSLSDSALWSQSMNDLQLFQMEESLLLPARPFSIPLQNAVFLHHFPHHTRHPKPEQLPSQQQLMMTTTTWTSYRTVQLLEAEATVHLCPQQQQHQNGLNFFFATSFANPFSTPSRRASNRRAVITS